MDFLHNKLSFFIIQIFAFFIFYFTLLTDQGSSAPVFIAKPTEQYAIEGSSITLECAANGNPRPSITWLKDGIAVDLAALDSR